MNVRRLIEMLSHSDIYNSITPRYEKRNKVTRMLYSIEEIVLTKEED